MNDPRRLRSDDDPESELGRILLRSAGARAPRAARHRAVVAATSALTATSLGASGAAAGSAVGKLGAVAAVKWLAATAIVGALAIGAVEVHERLGPASDHAAGPIAPGTTVPPQVLEPRGRGAALTPAIEATPPLPIAPPDPLPVEGSAPIAPAAHTARPAPSGTASTSATAIRMELATLERARVALDTGRPSLALSILHDYDSRFPDASMGLEASVLQIEALFAAGDSDTARLVASGFLTNHAQSPYAARVRSLIDASR
jgi:hypothetical protein